MGNDVFEVLYICYYFVYTSFVMSGIDAVQWCLRHGYHS
jgi:predicted HAD superfamily Cof-like phosphohydrolase